MDISRSSCTCRECDAIVFSIVTFFQRHFFALFLRQWHPGHAVMIVEVCVCDVDIVVPGHRVDQGGALQLGFDADTHGFSE